MTRQILIATAILAAGPAMAAGDYQPDKSAAKQAESYCESVMLMTKRSEDAFEILRNVRAEVTGHHIKGRKVVNVRYPYNVDGAGFFCGFVDYGRHRLTLHAFGEIWPDRKNVTRVEPLN